MQEEEKTHCKWLQGVDSLQALAFAAVGIRASELLPTAPVQKEPLPKSRHGFSFKGGSRRAEKHQARQPQRAGQQSKETWNERVTVPRGWHFHLSIVCPSDTAVVSMACVSFIRAPLPLSQHPSASPCLSQTF